MTRRRWNIPPSALEQIERFSEPGPNGCWQWTGPINKRNGYAQYTVDGTSVYGHRVSYELHVGPIPKGLHIDHLCRNTLCVNPDHLEPVTCRENIMRSPVAPAALNARKTECSKGHPFTPENTYVRKRRGGRTIRVCRTCSIAAARQQTKNDTAKRRAAKAARAAA